MMKISPEFLYEISSQLLSYNQICDLFGLTEDERKSPNAGKWIVDRIKQYQTAAIMRVEIAKRQGGLVIDRPEDQLPNPFAEKPLELDTKDRV